MTNLSASSDSGFVNDPMNNSIPVWSGEWLAHLLNPFVGQFNGVGASGQWIELGIRELLLSRNLNSEESPLSNENSSALSQLSSNFSIPSRSYSDRNVDLLTGQSDFGGFLAAAGLELLDNNILNGNEQFTPENKIGHIDAHELVDDSHIVATEFDTHQKVDLQHINPGDDARHLTPDKAQTDDAAPALTLALQTDTGWDATDGITQTPVLVGTVSSQSEVTQVSASVGEAILDITDQVQPDGSFTLDESLLRLLIGGPLVDDTYNISVTAEDRLGNASAPVEVSMTLDRTAAELLLKSPLVNGTHSGMVHLLGSADEAGILSTTLNDGIAVDMEVRDILDQSLQSLPLEDGAHQLTVHFSDIAGNVTEQVINFEVDGSAFVIGSTDTISWAATTDDEILLAEGNSFITQAQMPISLSQSEGSRTLRFAVDADFDTTDETATSGDTLAVYLISTDDPSQTLLENGIPGTPVFSLTADTADFMPGLVTYDGQFVEIDLTSLNAETEGTLIFQLLNQDGDTGSRIHISQLTNILDPKGTEALRFEETDTVVKLGGELALENLSVSKTIEPVLSQIRFNAETGEYTAHLQLRNTGEISISRQAAVVFDALPDGVSLKTLSGNDGEGNPYVNLYHAIRPGGLAAGELSDAISITVSNLEQLQLILMPQVLVGGPNQAPVFDPIDPVEVMPGQRIEILLNAVDPNGDRVTYSLRTDTDLPNGRLDGTGTLSFEPTPNDIGTYSFTVIASDGAESVEQTVTLNVVPDPITTTRISGRVLDTNGAPLANLPIELGRLQTVTDSDGYFILTVPDTSFPTDELDITVPFGDHAFDPFFTGTQVIDLRRTTFDGTTGTNISNPLRHPNLVSAYMNASMVYGNDTSTANALRTLNGTGQLKVSENNLLPLNNTDFFPDGPLPNSNRSLNDPATLFATGDVRANENIGLTAMHTVFVREHNRLATEIQATNPELSGDEIYNQARKQVAAQIQHITYSEYLPLLIGSDALDTYTGYDETADPAISHLFSAAAFRMGHTQSFSEFLLVDDNGEALPSVSLRESTFNPEIIHQYGIDAILRGLYAQSAEAIDTKVIDELRNTLFGPPGAGGIDLAAVDIERGRDVGLPDYNQARVDMGLAPVTSFAEITSDISIQAVLEQLYGTVDDIDVIVGGLAEDHVPGTMVGELFQAIMADQFTRLRDGDRFWYENGQFTQTELDDIRRTTLASLIQRNTDITTLPGYVFSNQGAPTAPEAAGTVASKTVTEYGMIDGSGHGQPGQGILGDLMGVTYTQEYGDGIRSVAGENRPNTREISNALFAQAGSIPDAQGSTGFMLAWSQFMGHDLSFSPAGAADTLKFYGTEYESSTGEEFPYVAEKIDLVLGHSLYAGVNNVIERPIYLPALDIVNNEQTTDSQGNITVTNNMLGAEVFVAANALSDREGNPFDGQLTISEVPTDLTPAALPEGLFPDLVVTIQPGEMAFEIPAQLTLPNQAGWPVGMEMELWSINPTTGDFEVVGTGVVSDDGSSIETIEGGIRNSSWHFFAPGALGGLDPNDPRNPDHRCGATEENAPFTSNVSLVSGGIIETHDLVSYQSLGAARGVTLTYDSLRADPSPIIHYNVDIPFNISGRGPATGEFKLISKLSFKQGAFEYEVPGFEGGQYGLEGGEHFWDVPSSGQGNLLAKPALQADLKELTSGIYEYALQAGVYAFANGQFSGRSDTLTNTIVHVNGTHSKLGNGWGISGVQELIENSDGSILIIDGNGSEIVFENEGGYVSPPGDFSTLRKLEEGTFQRITKEQTVYAFDSNNRLVSITDRNGSQTQHVYNVTGQLTEIIDPVGLSTQFKYANGHISKIIDPAKRETLLEYDASGNLTRITDPDSTSRQFIYDDKGHMVGETDKRGYQEKAIYDFAGRATQAIGKDGRIIKVQPPQVEGLYRFEETSTDPLSAPALPDAPEDSSEVTYSDGRGQVKTTVLDAAGQAVSVRDQAGALYAIQRNTDNLVETFTAGLGQQTTFDYDVRGNLIRLVDELSETGYSSSGLAKLDNSNSNVTSLLLFDNPGYFPGVAPQNVIAKDLNDDGYLDLVSVNAQPTYGYGPETSYISVFFGDPQGSFSGKNVVRFDNQFHSGAAIVVDDFDGDGNQDIVTNDSGSRSEYFVIAFGNGDGTFAEQLSIKESNQYPYDQRGETIIVYDLDSDGYKDILYNTDDEPAIIFGNPERALTAQVYLETSNESNGIGHMALADFNGDGEVDIVRQTKFYDSNDIEGIEVFLNQGSRNFSSSITNNLLSVAEALNEANAFITEDLDADGLDDIISIQMNNTAVTVLFGDIEAPLSRVDNYVLDQQPHQVKAADLNGDDQLDIVTANGSSDTVSILLNTGTGFTVATDYSIGDYGASFWSNNNISAASNSLQLKDINNDGYSDILTANEADNSLSVLLNRGDGSFIESVNYAVGEQPVALTLDDFNQDGFADIAVANSNASNGFISILLNQRNGDFEPILPLPNRTVQSFETSGSKELLVADFNNDGLDDLLSVDYSNSIFLQTNNDNATFATPIEFELDETVQGVATGDFNQDGTLDILVSTYDYQTRRSQIIPIASDENRALVIETPWNITGQVINLNVGEFNGDGILDFSYLVQDDDSGVSLAIWLGTEDNGFQQASSGIVAHGSLDDYQSADQSITQIADINDDGLDDLVYLRRGDLESASDDIFLVGLLGNGNGSFRQSFAQQIAPGSSASTLMRESRIKMADLNGDGSLDIVSVYGDEAYRDGQHYNTRYYLQTFLGSGNGAFSEQQRKEITRLGNSEEEPNLEIADVNNDRYADLILSTGGYPNSILSVLLGNETGQFDFQNSQQYRDYATPPGIDAVFLGKFNADDDIDVLLNDDQRNYILLNQLGVSLEDPGDEIETLATTLDRRDLINAKLFTYDDTFSQLTSVTDELGSTTLFTIDSSNGNTVKMRQVIGEVGGSDDIVTVYTYTDAGLVDLETDDLGRVKDYDYDSFGRLIKLTLAKGTANEATQLFSYDAAGNLTQFTDENGHVTAYEYDVMNRLIRQMDADPDGAGTQQAPVTLFGYDAAGNLIETTDANDNTTSFAYDPLNRLIQRLDADDQATDYAYDQAGNVVAMTNARRETTNYQYDARNRLISETDTEGGITTYQYDANNNLTMIEDAEGNHTNYFYDARQRLISIRDTTGRFTDYDYDAADNLVAVRDRNGHITRYRYDHLNRLIEIEDAEGNRVQMTYDEIGNIAVSIDQRGNKTRYVYDERNRLALTTDALDGEIRYDYDGIGNVLSIVDELDRETTYGYDALNRLTQVMDPLNHNTRYEYDGVGNLTQVAGELGRVVNYSYDNLNRQTQVTDAYGNTTRTHYDELGNVVAVTDKLGRTTRYDYDRRNWLAQTTDALGHITTYDYDQVGNLTALTDALGHQTRYEYDTLYRQTKSIDALGETATTTYDSEGNIFSLTDASGNFTTYTYDGIYQLATETITIDDINLTRSYDYDAVGNLIERVDRNGRTQTFAYDALNRLEIEQWLDNDSNPIRTISYGYDAASQLQSLSDPNAVYTYDYDLAGRLIQVDNNNTPGVPRVVFNYDYDAANNLARVADSIEGIQTGVESFSYDLLDRVTQITQSGNGVADKRVDMAYDAVSQMTGLTRYSDLTGTQLVAQTVYDYDAAGRIIELAHQRGNDIIADYGFSYDAANHLTQLVTPDGTSDYSYNNRNELTGADYSYQKNETYSYDATGNRTSNTTGDHNRLLSDGIYNYEYDNEGNRTRRVDIVTDEVTDYIWDHRNRLTAIVTTSSDGTVIKKVIYTYDAYDRRVAKVVDADGEGAVAPIEERFVYDGDHIALVFDGDGNQIHRYLHGVKIDQVLAEETADGETRWALTDHQGSVRDVIDNQGTVLNHITYDSFGQVTNQSNLTAYFRFGYTGRELDQESGQYFYRARHYDPSVGRFISEDPIGFDAGDTNLYRYVFNSSPNYVDPTGNYIESGWDLLSLGVGVASLGVNIRRRDWKNAAIDGVGITADVGALLLPVPGGVSAVRNADKVGQVATFVNRSQSLKRGTDFVKFNQRAKNGIRGAQLSNLGASIYQTGESGVQGYRSWRDSCSGEIPWRALIQTGLSGLGILGARNNVRRSFQRESVIANKIGTSKRLINSYGEFHKKYHQGFKEYPNNTIIGWEWYQESATTNRTTIIGRLPDIQKVFSEQKFHRLNIRQRQGWKNEVNDAWLQGVIDAGKPVKLVSPVKKATLKNPPDEEYKYTIYRRELQQLKSAGYTIRNGWAIPTGTTSP